MYELITTSSDGKLYQWNTNCKIWCDNADFNGREVQFDIANKPTAPVVNFSSSSNGVAVNIPNIVLQYAGILHVYIMDSSGSYVEDVISYMVHKRHKPDDYAYTEEALLTYKTLVTKIDELESEINAVSSRVDNLASLSEGSTTADAELIDIRVGADGTQYDSAGNAVRSQIEQNKRDMNIFSDVLGIGTTTDYTFVAGGISSDGTVNDSATNRVRSENYIWAKAGSTIGIKSRSTDTFNIATYSNTYTSSLLSYRGMSSDTFVVDQDCYIRFGITASDTSDPDAVAADTIDMHIIADTLPDVRAQTDQNAEDISQFTEEIAEFKSNWSDRHTTERNWKTYDLPDGFDDFPIEIITDGYNFRHNFDVTKYKNTGGTTYYVAPFALDGSAGTSVKGTDKANPTTFRALMQRSSTPLSDGDTIVFADGVYRDTAILGDTKREILRNINLIAENPGKVFWANVGTKLSYTSQGNGIYTTTQSNIAKVVQLLDSERCITTELKNVNSADTCAAEPGTYYMGSSDMLYVHMFMGLEPTYENLFVLLNYGFPVIDVACTSQNVSLYLDGINFLGGTPSTMNIMNSDTYSQAKIYAKNCKFLHAYDSALERDAVSIRGATWAMFENCYAGFASKDGFNYHVRKTVVPKFIEVNCIGANNGLDGVASGNVPAQNGSSAHDGVKGIRIGGKYYNNYGCNVADVMENTVTVNILCDAFDSAYTGTEYSDMYNADFSAQQSGATMYLDNCRAFGSKHSTHCVEGATMNLRNCDMEDAQSTAWSVSSDGNGNIVIEG